MKKTVTLVALLLMGFSLPAAASYRGENMIRVHAGLFEPEADSSYWDETFLDFTGDASDFEDTIVAFDYLRRISSRLSLLAGVSGYEGDTNQAYIDFVDSRGDDIIHNTRLEVSNINLGLVVNLAGGNSPVNPYLGAAAGFYSWELEEVGDFIDFATDPPEVFPSAFFDDGTTFGWFWLAGLDIKVGSGWSLFVEGRFSDVQTDDLEGDFQGLGELDLSGESVTVGAAWSF